MKFSLAQLLAVTLLACLAIKGANDIRIAEAKRIECEQLATEIASGSSAVDFFEEKKLIYTRAFDAFEKRKEALEAASELHEPAAVMFREPTGKDPEKIHVARYDNEYSRKKHSMQTNQCFRIWVPESKKYELCLGFHEPTLNLSQERELLKSYYFQPDSKFTIPLNPGGAIVQFHLTDYGTGSMIRLNVEGQFLHRANRPSIILPPKKSFLDFTNNAKDSVLVDGKRPRPLLAIDAGKLISHEPGPLTLLTSNYWLTKDNPESVSLVVRPVEERQRGAQHDRE